MGPPSLDFAGLLVTAGVGIFAAASGWGIFVSAEPDRPSTCVTLYDSGGFPPSPQIDIDEPTVMVRIRGATGIDGYPDGYAKALAVRDALHTFRGVVGSTTRYHGVWAMQDPTPLGKDDSARPLWTINFRILRSPVGGAYPR